jgi:hypothetical protein
MINWSDKLEDYLQGKLSIEDKNALESALKKDENLQKSLNIARDEWAARELLVEDDLRKKIKTQFKTQHNSSKSSISSVKIGFYLILLTILGALLWYLNHKSDSIDNSPKMEIPTPTVNPMPIKTDTLNQTKPNSPNNLRNAIKPNLSIPSQQIATNYQQIALAHYKQPSDLLSIRNTSLKDNYNLALEAFRAENYQETAKLLENSLVENNPFSFRLKAFAYFKSGSYDLAYRDFQFLQKDDIFRNEAQWMTLLCSLASNKNSKETFLIDLNKILADTTHDYYNEAKVLDKNLR